MDKNLADGTHSKNVGTAGTNVTATEYGNGFVHVTELTLSAIPITIGDTAALATGSLIYTFPAGVVKVQAISGTVDLTLTTGTPTTDTPEVGLGTTVGSGVVATLGAVDPAAENLAGPVAMTDIAGTDSLVDSATASGTKAYALLIAAADDHTVYLNFADTWANVDDTAATSSGSVYIEWTLLSAGT